MDSAPSFRERLVRHWYLPRLTLLTRALTPLSWLFGIATALRRVLYRAGVLATTRLPVPVIVVGNITVGGTGKTPLTAWLVRGLLKRGRRPGIVSRGHGGANATPRSVAGSDDPRVAGDEPLLLARTGVPIWIGRDRVGAARALLAAHPDVDVLVSDDGLQHYALGRDVEIIVVDGARGYGNGRLLPAGPLREPASRATTVDAIVITGEPSAGALRSGTTVPDFAMRLTGERFVNLADPTRSVDAGTFRGGRVHALAGIGNPERFFGKLREMGLSPVCHPFPDHHAYVAADIHWSDADAILMTDKDAIKCAALADARMWTLPVTAVVAPGLIERILEELDGRKAA